MEKLFIIAIGCLDRPAVRIHTELELLLQSFNE